MHIKNGKPRTVGFKSCLSEKRSSVHCDYSFPQSKTTLDKKVKNVSDWLFYQHHKMIALKNTAKLPLPKM